MVRSTYQKLIVFFMMATVGHLPLPLCDGANLGSESRAGVRPAHCSSSWSQFDIDFVFLGCDAPDDMDDGPIDDDPEGGSLIIGIGPVFLQTEASCPCHIRGRMTGPLPVTSCMVGNAFWQYVSAFRWPASSPRFPNFGVDLKQTTVLLI